MNLTWPWATVIVVGYATSYAKATKNDTAQKNIK
jgi:hypothetical protein